MSFDAEAAAAVATWAPGLRRLHVQHMRADLGPRALRALSAMRVLEDAEVAGQRLLRHWPSNQMVTMEFLVHAKALAA